MITVEGLSKYYAGHPAIEDVSFSIAEGEIVGLLGLNGAGKSTILKILGCFLMPSSGRAWVSGVSVEDEPQKVRSLIGYLPDVPPLYDEMRVSSYLKYVARIKDVSAADVQQRVQETIGKTNLEEVGDAVIGSLSHGYRQRVGIAQALVHNPRVLILDEPINGLDPVQIVEMRDLILSLGKQHTVILSSHILSEITRTCDRIVIVDKGHVVAEGNESQLQAGGAVVMKIVCEVVKAGEALVAAVKRVSGVTAVQVNSRGEHDALEVECQGDRRAEVAKAIVSAGGALLSMQRQGGGLENLFMKFVTA